MRAGDGQDRQVTRGWRPATLAVRGGTARSWQGETSEALYLTSGFSYATAEEAAARFRGDRPGPTYSRLQNPTVAMLEERLALLEGAEACRVTASGMAAMTAAVLSHLSAGDHAIAARTMFGSCRWLFDQLLPRLGIATTIVDGPDTSAWAAARRANTRLLFLETPANPTLDILDVRAIADIAHDAGAILVVDNALSGPTVQRPLELGADVVCYSATKSMDGQGRVLAGAVLGGAAWITDTLLAFTRNTGPTLSPFNAWLVLKALEHLELRVARMGASAQRIAEFLEPRLPRVAYPGLASHPGHALARAQMPGGFGHTVALWVVGGRDQAFALLDALRLIDISNNLGDARSMMTHPFTTTHTGVEESARPAMGVTDELLRLSVGLEDVDDLIEDLDQALRAIGR